MPSQRDYENASGDPFKLQIFDVCTDAVRGTEANMRGGRGGVNRRDVADGEQEFCGRGGRPRRDGLGPEERVTSLEFDMPCRSRHI